MKSIASILFFCSLCFGDQYTFLVDSYDKEIELEAKIISKIATASIKKEIKLFIPEISRVEQRVYSRFFTLVQDCKDSNFVFINKRVEDKNICAHQPKKLFFTNNYRKLLADNRFFGAFFWSKSRPNIVFIKDRLKKNSVALPKEYDRYVEDFNGQ